MAVTRTANDTDDISWLRANIDKYVAADQKDMAKIIFGLEHNSEEIVLEGVKNFKATGGKEKIQTLNADKHMIWNSLIEASELRNVRIETYHVNFFAAAVFRNFKNVVAEFLACGVGVDNGNITFQSGDVGRFVNASPLAIACDRNLPDMIKMLLEKNPDLLRVTKSGASILTFVKSEEARQLILDAAGARGCLDKLLSLGGQLPEVEQTSSPRPR